MGRVIYCYGDSNTWGFDSRSYMGERYPKGVRWTGILESHLACAVINDGMNGRKIPSADMPVDFLTAHIRKTLAEFPEPAKSLCLLIMLGTNDLLDNPGGGAVSAAAKINRFLSCLQRKLSGRSGNGENMQILLIAPPHLRRGAWVENDELVRQSFLLGPELCRVADNHRIFFADAGAWDIPLLYDGVHFSEEGHRIFAENIMRILIDLQKDG